MSAVVRFDPQACAFLQVHPKLGKDLMEHLWQKLDAKYPAQWRACFKGGIDTWKETWAESFEREGLTPHDIKAGLDNITKVCPDFPPNEAQFIRACQQAGDIDAEAAYCEAVEQLRLREEGRDNWSHPAIYWAATRIGSFDMRNSTWSSIKGRWSAELKRELANKPYQPVPEPRVALPAPGQTTLTPEQVAENVARLKQMMTGAFKRMPGSEVRA